MEQEHHILQVQRQAFLRSDRPLRSVLGWELRRLRANRLSWVVASLALLFFLSLIWLKHSWLNRKGDLTIPILGSTSLGLVYEITLILMLMLGMFLPFVAAEAVARDYKQRMHELLITTTLPTWAYVWGRYLARLLVSLALAFAMLVALLLMNLILHLTLAEYPGLKLGSVLLIWSITVISATILVSGLSFALGTQWPQLAIVTKLAVLVGWIILEFQNLADMQGHNAWRAFWNPTSRGMLLTLGPQFAQHYGEQARNVANVEHQVQIAMQLQQQLPNLWPWVAPYLLLACLGLALVALAGVTFQRFRTILD